jgi:hypothetical protein
VKSAFERVEHPGGATECARGRGDIGEHALGKLAKGTVGTLVYHGGFAQVGAHANGDPEFDFGE